MEKFKVLISEKDIRKRVKGLASEINRDYKGEHLYIIGILNGCYMFLSDLTKELNMPCTVDFMRVSSYGNATETSGIVRIIMDVSESLADKNVLIVEDIIDTGLTMDYLIRTIKQKKPKSVKICTLLHKKVKTRVNVNIDYCGFVVPDKFVVGYGLDYNNMFRNLKYIGYK
ncbi:MAG: hypoxanthine phosphoribosyltransferase [Deltaproteobacteria bacterium]|nr:hypoxanthine phosphoribosyltransferase [Deltaproteobacteria bacterium]